MKIFLVNVLFFGLAFIGFCGTTNETNSIVQIQREQLFNHTYKITAAAFWDNLKRLSETKEGEDNPQMLRSFFEKNGVEMTPPTVVFLDLGPFPKPNEGKNFLFVRATQADQNKIEKLVLAIQNNVQPSEVH